MTEETTLHPLHQCNDGFFNSFSGKKISLHAPTADMICLQDIAKGLANICRFGGQIHGFYPVASHTLTVWHLAPDHLKKAALLHDAPEAYLGDVIKPLKVILGDAYGFIEKRFERVIFGKYQVDLKDLEAIKPYDMKAVELEHSYFRTGDPELIHLIHDIFLELGYKEPYRLLLNVLKENFLQYEVTGSSLDPELKHLGAKL